MHLARAILCLSAALLPSTNSLPVDSQELLSAPNAAPEEPISIPSRYTSTLLGRRLLASSPTGVLSTVFPAHLNSSTHRPPPDLASTPIALPDYIADCEDDGNPTVIALSVSTSTRNALAGSNVSLAVSWWDAYSRLMGRRPWSAANLPRASLIGYLERMGDAEVEEKGIVECYTTLHPDSRLWLPGDKDAAHKGFWMRMVVQEVYWVGGFGDRNYIGWFDIEEWRDVGRQDWERVKLPGEK